jgi:hypothetical protein
MEVLFKTNLLFEYSITLQNTYQKYLMRPLNTKFKFLINNK